MSRLQQLASIRGQAVMTASMLLISAVAALSILPFRSRFEQWSALGFVSKPQEVVALLDELLKESNSKRVLSDQERGVLFEGWLRSDDPRLEIWLPRWVEQAPEPFVQRCERAIVCGNAEQKERGLTLLRSLPTAESSAAYLRLQNWATRRKQTSWAKRLADAAHSPMAESDLQVHD